MLVSFSVIIACTEYQFTCGNGDCISNSRVCDGSPDCYDQNDESNCGKYMPTQSPCNCVVCTVAANQHYPSLFWLSIAFAALYTDYTDRLKTFVFLY